MVHDTGQSEGKSMLCLIFIILLTAHEVCRNVRIIVCNEIGIGYCGSLLSCFVFLPLRTCEAFLGKEYLSYFSLTVTHLG